MIQQVVMGTRLPAKLWTKDVESACMEQIVNLASLPFAFKHVAIMPDAHAGSGMPIGGVLATNGVIVPNAVGVDIGCGMCAVNTGLKVGDVSRESLRAVTQHIRENIPLGFEVRKEPLDESCLPKGDISLLPVLRDKKDKILREIGTLGGGNHFIELQRDMQKDDLWIMIHSGSRNTGYQVAKHYNKIAKYWCDKWYSEYFPDLAFMPVEVQDARDYMAEMNYCVQIAFANRSVMMEEIKRGFVKVLGHDIVAPIINIAHNYAALENHFGQNVIVHRKGATSAKLGEIGIIPGSMGTKSYIVEGLGNPMSFMSCSHGAGRRMSRNQARQVLSLEDQKEMMDSRGIIHNMTEATLDEAPGAYKDIEEVISLESDLVRPIVELEPIAVVKGE